VWAVGAIEIMTLAMRTRATLGHTGRVLAASRGTRFAYLCIVVALGARTAMACLPDLALPLTYDAGVRILAFAAFLFTYAPMLV